MYVPAPKLSSKRKVGWLGCSNFKQPLMKRPTRPFAPCPGWAPRWGPREVGHALSHTMRVGEMETRQTWVSREAWLLEEVQEGQKSNKCFSRDERIEYKRDCPLDTFFRKALCVSAFMCMPVCVQRFPQGRTGKFMLVTFGKTNGTMFLVFIFFFSWHSMRFQNVVLLSVDLSSRQLEFITYLYFFILLCDLKWIFRTG